MCPEREHVQLIVFFPKDGKHCHHLNLKGATAAMLTLLGSLPRRCMLNERCGDFGLFLGTSTGLEICRSRLDTVLTSLWTLAVLPVDTAGITLPFAPLAYNRCSLPWPTWTLVGSEHRASPPAALSTLLRRHLPKVQFWLALRLNCRSRRALWLSVLARRSSVSLERGASLFGTWGLLYAEHVPSLLLWEYRLALCCSTLFFTGEPLAASWAEQTVDEEYEGRGLGECWYRDAVLDGLLCCSLGATLGSGIMLRGSGRAELTPSSLWLFDSTLTFHAALMADDAHLIWNNMSCFTVTQHAKTTLGNTMDLKWTRLSATKTFSLTLQQKPEYFPCIFHKSPKSCSKKSCRCLYFVSFLDSEGLHVWAS